MALIAAETAPPPQSARIGGDSSPSSVETTFRELDDVFLQTQTRIWLGEVLGARLDEQMSISELLSDGELLLEVSRVIWEMLVTRRMELGHLNPFKYDPFASRKGSGRYTPYSNVDSFLKICKILGLSGIDLFSPSDVVEKKNTRKVCICVRLLSKKARSKALNVPDFDIVTCTASMPTDMVGFIRRRLELSHCSSSSSASYESPPRVIIAKTRQSHLIAAFANSLYSEDEDGTESTLVQSDSPHVCLQDMSYEDYQEDSPIVGEHFDASSIVGNRYQDSSPESNSFLLNLSNDFSTEEEFGESVTPERSCVPCQSGISGFVDHQSSADDTEVITGSYASNFLCSYEANKTPSSSENEIRHKFHDEYLEGSPVSSTNSVSGPLRMDFYDENDSGNTYEDIKVSEIVRSKSEQPEELDCVAKLGDGVGDGVGDDITCDGPCASPDVVSTVERKSSQILTVNNSNCLQTEDAKLQSIVATGRLNAVDGDGSYGGHDFVAEPHLSESSNSSDEQQGENDGHRFHKTNSTEDMKSNPDHYQDDMKPTISEVSRKQHSNEKDNLQSIRRPADEKSQSRPLLKSIASGTAVLGVMFLVLQFRKSSKEKRNESAPTNQKQTTNGASSPAPKQTTRDVQKAVYPAEKLNFGK